MPRRPSLRLRAWASRISRSRRDLPVARSAYTALVRAEVGVASLLARRRAVGPADPGNLTLVVKTFERPHLLSWMLSSARRVFSGPVIVADDSEAVFESADPRVRVLAMPFDSGIGPGRNALIDAASTEFVWMADDDEIMPVDLDVARVVAYCSATPRLIWSEGAW